MSIGVGIVAPCGVALAADSQGTGGGAKFRARKLHRWGALAYAVAGTAAGGRFLEVALDRCLRSDGTISTWAVSKDLRRQFDEEGWESVRGDGDGDPRHWNQMFLLTDGATLWMFQSNTFPMRADRAEFIGSGHEAGQAAHCALSNLGRDWFPKHLAFLCAEAAAETCAGCGGPVDVEWVERPDRGILVP